MDSGWLSSSCFDDPNCGICGDVKKKRFYRRINMTESDFSKFIKQESDHITDRICQIICDNNKCPMDNGLDDWSCSYCLDTVFDKLH